MHQIDEDGVALHLAGVLHAQVVRVGVHGHDLLLDVLGLIGEVDAVAEALAHLGLAVGAGQAQAGAVLGQNDLRLHQSLTVDRVELMNDLAALLDMGRWSSPAGTVVALKAVMSAAWLMG